MAQSKMHIDEMDIDASLVRRLVAAQFPQWAELPIEPVDSAGTDNALYRLGSTMSVRLPRVSWVTGQVTKEQQWLPILAPQLQLAVPAPVGLGEPSEDYPWHWSVYNWIDGEPAVPDRITDPHQVAAALGRFVATLQRIDPTGGPVCGDQNFHRGVPLVKRDQYVRPALEALGDVADTDAAARIWDAALATPVWHGDPVWLHGDLHAGNLLADGGRLTAVIDFGGLGVGDPACDVMAAWTYLTAKTRPTFRAELDIDGATWERGRGWALSVALVALAYYRETNPSLSAASLRTIHEVLDDAQPTAGTRTHA